MMGRVGEPRALEELVGIVGRALVAELGVEGGGATVCGREVNGAWRFWQEGSSMGLDENEDEDWRSWSTEPVGDLGQALPAEWLLMYPIEVHPSFLPWFRERYESQRARLSASYRRMHDGHLRDRWRAVLFGPRRGGPLASPTQAPPDGR